MELGKEIQQIGVQWNHDCLKEQFNYSSRKKKNHIHQRLGNNPTSPCAEIHRKAVGKTANRLITSARKLRKITRTRHRTSFESRYTRVYIYK